MSGTCVCVVVLACIEEVFANDMTQAYFVLRKSFVTCDSSE
jgi:hypothetical protein